MALPTSGPLSFSAIDAELGVPATNISLRNMSNIAGFASPDAVSEFYGYNPLYFINLGYDSTAAGACSLGGGTPAFAGWYSDGLSGRYWTGGGFGTSLLCGFGGGFG